MSKKHLFLKELEGAPTLYGLKKSGSVFSVPEGYFLQLSEEIAQKIEQETLEGSALEKEEGRKSVFSVPEGYFSANLERIQDLIKEESGDAAPLGFPTDRSPVFQVPDGYFEQLPGRISQRIREDAPAGKVMRFWRPQHGRWGFSPWAGLAAAATALVFIWFGYFSNGQQGTSREVSFSQLSTEELFMAIDVAEYDTYSIAQVAGEETLEQMSYFEEVAWDEEEWDLLLDQVDLKDLESSLEEL